MIRGTTPLHVFTLPINTALCKEIKITYAQDDHPVLMKKKNDCTLNGNTVSVRLTQQDTFLFDHEKNVQIQVRVLTLTGEALCSTVKRITVGRCLESEVLV